LELAIGASSASVARVSVVSRIYLSPQVELELRGGQNGSAVSKTWQLVKKP
jgi:hypothetical protein